MTYGNLKSEVDNTPVLSMIQNITNHISAGGLVLPKVASATLLLDLEADMLILSDSDPISTWTDQSGSGHHFTQTGSERPTKQTVLGMPVVVPDGIDDWMNGSNFANNLDKFAIFVIENVGDGTYPVISKLAVIFDYQYNGWMMDTAGGFRLQSNPGTLQATYSKLIQFPNSSPTTGTRHLFISEKLDNSTIHVYVDGVLDDALDPASLTGDPITSFSTSETVKLFVEGGADGPDDFGYGNKPVSAILLYQITNLVNWPTDRVSISNYLIGRYNINVPYPLSLEIGFIDALTVAVIFNMDVAADDFSDGVTIKVNSVVQTMAGFPQDAKTVYYVLDNAVSSGDSVTWEYSQASGNIVSLADDIPMENVTPQSVTNNVM